MIPAYFDGASQSYERPVRVLLAEDEFLLRLDVADSIRGLGWHVVEVSSADEALELLRHRVRFDLLVTDVNMPGRQNGFDFARFIRSNHPDMRIAIMSTDVPDQSSDPALWDMFLRKPVWDVAHDLRRLMGVGRHED